MSNYNQAGVGSQQGGEVFSAMTRVMDRGSPREIFQLILSSCNRGTLATVARLSPLWRQATESLLYEHLDLTSDASALAFTHSHFADWAAISPDQIRVHRGMYVSSMQYDPQRTKADKDRSQPVAKLKPDTERLHSMIRSVRICSWILLPPIENDILVQAIQPVEAIHIQMDRRVTSATSMVFFFDLEQPLHRPAREGSWTDRKIFSDNNGSTCRRLCSLLFGHDLCDSYRHGGVRSISMTAHSVDLVVSWEQLDKSMGEASECGKAVEDIGKTLVNCDHVNIFFVDEYNDRDPSGRATPVNDPKANDLDVRYLEVWCRSFLAEYSGKTDLYMLANIPLKPDPSQLSGKEVDDRIDAENSPVIEPLRGLVHGLTSPVTGERFDSIAESVAESMSHQPPRGTYTFKSRADWLREHGKSHHFEPRVFRAILSLDHDDLRTRQKELRGSFDVDVRDDLSPRWEGDPRVTQRVDSGLRDPAGPLEELSDSDDFVSSRVNGRRRHPARFSEELSDSDDYVSWNSNDDW